MDHAFEARKAELERECIVEEGMFAGVLDRLDKFVKPFLNSFARYKQCDHATTVLGGLCSDLERKNAESIAYHFGMDRKPIQHFIGESEWDDTPLRIEMANQISTELGSDDGVLIFDPSAFPKSGKESVGVKRQWCGRSGKVDNCQVGVFMAYASEKGHALVDGDLYLPKEWISDKKRAEKARIPEHKRKYRTRTQICLELLELHAHRFPHSWITGDDEMGQPAEFRRKLRTLDERYLLAVPKNTSVADLEIPPPKYGGLGRPPVHRVVRIENWTKSQPDESWERIDVRDGEKGPLIVEVLKGRVETSKRSAGGAAEETCVVIRYKDRDEAIVKQDYYLSNAAYDTSASEFARAAKSEHRIEECFDRGKGEAGMADYEVRSWVGWQHHQTLSMIASWFLNVETRRSEKKSASDDIQSSSPVHCLDPSLRARMRFAPRRQTPRRAATKAKSDGTPISLETT